MPKLVEHWCRMREIVGLNHGRVKPMTYKVDTCRFLARCSALLGQGKDWLAQYQYNVTDGELGHGDGGLVSQWGSTIKSP